MHDNIERRSRTHRHHNLVGAVRKPGLVRQRVGDGLPGFDVSGIGHVPVDSRRIVRGEAVQLFEELRRWFRNRIAQREIEDVLGAALLAELDAKLKHPADPGTVLHRALNVRRNCHRLLSESPSRGSLGQATPALPQATLVRSIRSRRGWSGRPLSIPLRSFRDSRDPRTSDAASALLQGTPDTTPSPSRTR